MSNKIDYLSNLGKQDVEKLIDKTIKCKLSGIIIIK